jgi:hypothetical protein
MNQPPLEVADIIRMAGDGFIDRNERHLAWPQLKTLRAIRNCRTQALGGHLDRCSTCGHEAISYIRVSSRHQFVAHLADNRLHNASVGLARDDLGAFAQRRARSLMREVLLTVSGRRYDTVSNAVKT